MKDTKALLFGIIGFIVGGLLVSIAAATFDKPKQNNEMSMSNMTASLQTKMGDEYDKTFIAEMITHHQAAVDMAKLSATRAKHQEIKTLSTDIIAAQQKEIDRMKTWQANWGYSGTAASGSMQHMHE